MGGSSLKPIFDFDKLDNIQKYVLLQNAKGLLKYLNDEYDEFPYDVYFSGTDALTKSMAFVDSVIHGEI